MSKLVKYPKIRELGHSENAGILHQGDEMVVEEKLDGSNFRFCLTKDGIEFGSRTQLIAKGDLLVGENSKMFFPAINYVNKNVNHSELVDGYIYFGECCIPHTIQYDWNKIPPLVGFDIFDLDTGFFLSYEEKVNHFKTIGVICVPLVVKGAWGELNEKDLKVPPSEYYNGIAEGIVIKNYAKQLFAKIRTDEFKEKNKEVFGGGPKVDRKQLASEYFIKRYCTNARIEKCIHKLVDDGNELDMAMMPLLYKIVYKDIWEEEWEEIIFSGTELNLPEIIKMIASRCAGVLKQVIMRRALQNESIRKV